AAAVTQTAAAASATLNPGLDPVASLPPSATLAQDPAGSPTPAPADTSTVTPGPPLAPTACTQTEGQFSSVSVPSGILGYDIAARVYLPPCYAGSGQAYPVLYMIHGLNSGEEQWEQLGIGTVADHLIAAGDIAPLIIVLPRDR